MKKRIPCIIIMAAILGWIVMPGNRAQAQTTDSLLADSDDQSEFPQVIAQPTDQVVHAGSDVVLSVQAANADSYQWLRNGVAVDSQTNSVLIIENAEISDVGLYSCAVSKEAEIVPTRAAAVTVETVASATTATAAIASLSCMEPITVYGTPLLSSGKRGTCPGAYIGYVAYTKTVSEGWGWAPMSGATVLTAADGSGRTDTKIQYVGAYGDAGCAQTSVAIPYPPFSPVYRFTIYFSSNVPTNAYPIILTGFNL
jgi:hypothetical protein